MGLDGVVRHDLLANTQHTGTSADAAASENANLGIVHIFL